VDSVNDVMDGVRDSLGITARMAAK
jgi:hypothetical protein